MGINAYQNNFSIDEFLLTAFLLMKRKVQKIYDISKKEVLSVEDIKEKFEMSSQVLESLRLLHGSLDPSNEFYRQQTEAYDHLQLLLFKGNTENSLFYEEFIRLLPQKN